MPENLFRLLFCRSFKSCIYDQVRQEEQITTVQFLGSQQDVSSSRLKNRKQVRECPIWHSVGNPCGELDFSAKDEVRAGVYCRDTFEPSLFSPIGHGPLVFVGCVCWEVWFLVVLFLSMIFPESQFCLIETTLFLVMNATIGMMSVAPVQKKNQFAGVSKANDR